MTKKVGFDFDEFGGNVDVVILEGNSEDLNNSIYVQSLQSDGQFKQVQGLDWSVFDGQVYFSNEMETLAKELSKEFSTKAIYFYFGDASGWMGYKFFESGTESQEYSFGESYDEEMLEMGIDLADQTRKDGTLIVSSEEGEQFIFWSRIRSKTENEICQGEKFIDEFLRIQKAYIGWNLFSSS